MIPTTTTDPANLRSTPCSPYPPQRGCALVQQHRPHEPVGRTPFRHYLKLAGDGGCGDESDCNGEGTGLVRGNGIIAGASLDAPDYVPPSNAVELTRRGVGKGAANEEGTDDGGAVPTPLRVYVVSDWTFRTMMTRKQPQMEVSPSLSLGKSPLRKWRQRQSMNPTRSARNTGPRKHEYQVIDGEPFQAVLETGWQRQQS